MRKCAFLIVVISFLLSSCGKDISLPTPPTERKEDLGSAYEVAIFPHHGITGKNIDEFYSNLQEKYKRFDRIVILSPDHFGLEKDPVGSLPLGLKKICYQGVCIRGAGVVPYSNNSDIGRIFDASGVTREHGIGEHLLRISRYFPDAVTSPLLLRRNLVPGVQEENIANLLTKIPEKRVLIIASVDFSHHVREELAILHDRQSVDILRNGLIEDFSTMEVDCRNCLAVAKILAQKQGKDEFTLLKRTSVDIITRKPNDIENTSHIFGIFTPRQSLVSGELLNTAGSSEGVFLFAGDTHWARGFPYYEKKVEGYTGRVARIFYQQYDITNDLRYKYHRIFSGFDEVIVNFESALASNTDCPHSAKSTQMWTDPKYLPWFHSFGITLANIANNHSHDCGKKVFESTYSGFLSSGITPFGYDSLALRSIRGNMYAFLSFDTIESHPDIASKAKEVADLTASGYIVIANVHWGIEYATGHSERQKNIAHDLIDAGARLVIGHHPHVVQDSEIYKGVPIYYSLGNFLFDQPFPETLRGLLVGCAVSRTNTTCQEVSVYRNPKDFSLSFSSEK